MDGRGEASEASRLTPELVSCFHCAPANIFHVNGERRGEERREGGPNRGYRKNNMVGPKTEDRRGVACFQFPSLLDFRRKSLYFVVAKWGLKHLKV